MNTDADVRVESGDAALLRAALDDAERCNMGTPDYLMCPKCEHIFDLKGHEKAGECRVEGCPILALVASVDESEADSHLRATAEARKILHPEDSP